MQNNNWVISNKNGKDKSPLFCGNRERVITMYGSEDSILFI